MRQFLIGVFLLFCVLNNAASGEIPATGTMGGSSAPADDKHLIVFSQVLKDSFGNDLPSPCLVGAVNPETHQPVIDPETKVQKCAAYGQYTLGYACVIVLSASMQNTDLLDAMVAREDLVRKIVQSTEGHVPVALTPKEKRLIVDRLDKFPENRKPFSDMVAVTIARLIDPDSLSKK